MASSRFYLSNILAAGLIITYPNAFAASYTTTLPDNPGVTLSGLLGDISSGWADAMIPAFGNPISFLFLDPQVLYHNGNEYSGSLGAGWRGLTPQAGILSAYLFADYNHSDAGKSFWFLSPGIQTLGEVFDFSFNLYFPISSRQENTGQVFASDLGIYDFVSFSGHDQTDELVNTFESVGNGGDIELGFRLPFLSNNSKLYAGGYYFAPKNNDHITGGTARLDFPINQRITVSLSDGYDNVNHNIMKAGLTLSLVGRTSGIGHPSLAQRMVDPVHRDLAAIVGGSHTAQPIEKGEEFTGQFAISQSNIWFFEPNAPVSDGSDFNDQECTYEHPCTFNQTTIDSIDSISPNANLYMASGSYVDMSDTGQISINSGQTVYGRTEDYKAPAQGDSRPLLFGSLELEGYNGINNVQLANDGYQDQAILIDDNATIWINDVLIGNWANNPNQAYITGILLGNNDSVYIFNSDINAYSNDELFNQSVAGIKIDGTSNNSLVVTNSNIYASIDNSEDGTAFGVFVGNQDNSSWASNNKVYLNWDYIKTYSNFESAGIFLGNYNTDAAVTTDNLISTSFTKIDGCGSSPFGVFLGNLLLGDSDVNYNSITMSHSIINESADVGSAIGLFTGNFQVGIGDVTQNQVSLNHSRITADANSDNSNDAFGMFVGNNFSANGTASGNQFYLYHNQIYANANNENSSVAFGIFSGNFDSGPFISTLSDESFFLKDNQIDAHSETDFVEAAAFLIEANDSIVKLINNVFNVSSISRVAGIQLLGNDSYYYLSGNQVTATTNTNDSSSAQGLFVSGDRNDIVLENNSIYVEALSSGTGIFIDGEDNNLSSTADSIMVKTTGDFGLATGVFIRGSDNQLSFTNDQIKVSALGDGVNAYGINVLGDENTINLTSNKINVSSAQGSAYGLVDFKPSGNNHWNVDLATFTNITVDGQVQECKEFFGGICIN